MEELVAVAGICILLGSAGFLWTWPLPTFLFLTACGGGAVYLVRRVQTQNRLKDSRQLLLDRIERDTEFAALFAADLPDQLQVALEQAISHHQDRSDSEDLLAELYLFRDITLPRLSEVWFQKCQDWQTFLQNPQVMLESRLKELQRDKAEGKQVDDAILQTTAQISAIHDQRKSILLELSEYRTQLNLLKQLCAKDFSSAEEAIQKRRALN